MATPYAIDTHCHAHLCPPAERKPMLERAFRAGVLKVVNPACTLEELAPCLALAQDFETVWAAVGIHPTEVPEDFGPALEAILAPAKHEPKVVAIGEIGLDYYHDRPSRDRQISFLAEQLRIAKQVEKPAILHCRSGKNAGDNDEAFADLFALVQRENFFNAVLHCFSGTLRDAQQALEMGLMLSFTGIITYPSNEDLREVVRQAPLERIFIETDSPFLAPAAHRGKRNEPAFVLEVAQTIAQVKSVDMGTVLRQTSANAERFFGI